MHRLHHINWGHARKRIMGEDYYYLVILIPMIGYYNTPGMKYNGEAKTNASWDRW